MTGMDANLKARLDIVLDHLDETLSSGAGTVRELVAEAERLMEQRDALIEDELRAEYEETIVRLEHELQLTANMRDIYAADATEAKGIAAGLLPLKARISELEDEVERLRADVPLEGLTSAQVRAALAEKE